MAHLRGVQEVKIVGSVDKLFRHAEGKDVQVGWSRGNGGRF